MTNLEATAPNDLAASHRHREFLVWTASWPIFYFLYFVSAGHDVWTAFWGANFEDGPMFVAVFVCLGAIYVGVQAWCSTSLPRACVRALTLACLLALGFWEEFPKAIACAVLYLVVVLLARGLRKVARRGKVITLPPAAPHDGQRWVWVAVLLVALIVAATLRPYLLARFSTEAAGTGLLTGGDNLRMYRIPPRLIMRFVYLAWAGAFIFAATSGWVLLRHKFKDHVSVATTSR